MGSAFGHIPLGQDFKAEACVEADIAFGGRFQKGRDACCVRLVETRTDGSAAPAFALMFGQDACIMQIEIGARVCLPDR